MSKIPQKKCIEILKLEKKRKKLTKKSLQKNVCVVGKRIVKKSRKNAAPLF